MFLKFSNATERVPLPRRMRSIRPRRTLRVRRGSGIWRPSRRRGFVEFSLFFLVLLPHIYFSKRFSFQNSRQFSKNNRSFAEFPRVYPSFSEFSELPSFAEFCRVLPSFAEFCRVLTPIYCFKETQITKQIASKKLEKLASTRKKSPKLVKT